MQAFIVTCDAAQVDQSTGKVSMLGGDWAVTGPETSTIALVVFLRLSWEEAAVSHPFLLRLLNDLGEPVEAAVMGTSRPVQFAGRLTLNESADDGDETARLVNIHSSFTVTAPDLGSALTPGERYTWSFEVDQKEIASMTFAVRARPEPEDE